MIENEYRYYIYDFLIGQHLLTIDTVGKEVESILLIFMDNVQH